MTTIEYSCNIKETKKTPADDMLLLFLSSWCTLHVVVLLLFSGGQVKKAPSAAAEVEHIRRYGCI